MDFFIKHLLSVLIFFPVVSIFLLLPVNKKNEWLLRNLSTFLSLVEFIFSLYLFIYFRPNTYKFQFVEKFNWIPSFGASYFLGIDGVSLFLILLTTLLTFVSLLSSYRYIKAHVKEFVILMLLLETFMLGTFAALDVLLFYLFWEFMLIPMYFIIGMWGTGNRVYSAVKFVLYTLSGSLIMLFGLIYIFIMHYDQTGNFTFNILRLYNTHISDGLQLILFIALFLGFAIKIPLFPFHTWLPDAHTEAPTAGSVILAGVLLKFGVYGFFRFAIPLLPREAFALAPFVIALSVIGILYGAFVSIVQKDLKRLVAFSSVSHMGFIMLGLFAMSAISIDGSVIQLLNHGIATGALFLFVGMLYERMHTRQIKDFGGIAKKAPIFTAFFMISVLASVGLPGLNGFIGEFLILVGAFRSYPVLTIIGASGIIFAAVYLLWMFQRVMFQDVTNPAAENFEDMNLREIITVLPLIILMFLIGFYPMPFLERIDPTVLHFLSAINHHKTVYNLIKLKTGLSNA